MLSNAISRDYGEVVPGFADKTPADGAETWPRKLKWGQIKISVLSAEGKLVTMTVCMYALSILHVLNITDNLTGNTLVIDQKSVLKSERYNVENAPGNI